jgi:radical SAM superfamily enzyme YgiQ (UPF0313 family)
MRVTFIKPGMNSMKSSDAMQPLVFAVLAALTPPEIDRVFYDDRIENIPYGEATDLVAISVDTFSAARAYKIAQEYLKRNISVIMGGYHPTLCSNEALENSTSIAIGDAETIWGNILEDWQNMRLQKIYRSNDTSTHLQTEFDRSIFSGKKYAPINLLQWGRGCPHNCDFCSIDAFYGNRQCLRSIDDVIGEVASFGKGPVFFVDDNILHDKNKLTIFLNELSQLNIKWVCQISIDAAKDKALMKLLEKSGCIAAIIGFESLNEKNLLQMKKQWNVAGNDYATSVQVFRDHGIMIYGTFVFGYDYDTPDAFDISLDFAMKSRFVLANFNPLTPTPGTALYNRLLKEGRLIYPQWWIDPAYRYGEAIFHPKKITADELTKGCFRARATFNKYSSIFSRMFDRNANFKSLGNLSIYISANLMNRKEIHKKQGQLLGV